MPQVHPGLAPVASESAFPPAVSSLLGPRRARQKTWPRSRREDRRAAHRSHLSLNLTQLSPGSASFSGRLYGPVRQNALEPQHPLDHAASDAEQPRAYLRKELGRTRLADTVDGPDLLPCSIEAFVALQLLQLCVGELPEIPVRFAGEIGL